MLATSSVELVSHRLKVIQFGIETVFVEPPLPYRLISKTCTFSCQICQFIIICPKPPNPPVIICNMFFLFSFASIIIFELSGYGILLNTLVFNIVLMYNVGFTRSDLFASSRALLADFDIKVGINLLQARKRGSALTPNLERTSHPPLFSWTSARYWFLCISPSDPKRIEESSSSKTADFNVPQIDLFVIPFEMCASVNANVGAAFILSESIPIVFNRILGDICLWQIVRDCIIWTLLPIMEVILSLISWCLPPSIIFAVFDLTSFWFMQCHWTL